MVDRGFFGDLPETQTSTGNDERVDEFSPPADTTPEGLSTSEWCHAFCVALVAGPQQSTDVLAKTWFNDPECDPVAEQFYDYLWENRKVSPVAGEVWTRIDKHFEHAMLHQADAWQRRGGGRSGRPGKNLWRRTQGRPHTARKE